MAKEDITTKYKLDISDFKKNISEANKQIKISNAQFKAAAAGMDDWSKSSDGLNAKLKQLGTNLDLEKSKAKSYEAQMKTLQTAYSENGNKVEQLKAKLQELANQGVKKTSEEYKKYEDALNKIEQEQLSNKKAMDDLNITIVNQQGKINGIEKDIRNYTNSLDNLGKEQVEVKDNTSQLNEGYTILKGTIANLTSQVISKAVSGLKKLASKTIGVGKEAVKSYAEYEQLVGGVETLFKKSAGKVEKYANNAYKTAGLSANEYMETVTSFSASLLQGLGGNTKKAAKIADQAIIDMSDNANKMGTAMESIQNAYQGFAKGNFTMLDNLKLGYGGTKTEMVRLINDSGILQKKIKKIDEVSFDQMILAIHKVQDNIGITGTTAKEAEDTIEGSVNSMKASWKNLLTGLANGKVDNKVLLKNFTSSVKTVGKNLLPVVKTTIIGIVDTARDSLNEMLGGNKFKFSGEGVIRKIKEAFKKLIDTLEWFKKNKTIVVNVIKAITAAFVVSKINSFIQPLNGIVTGFGGLVVSATKAGGALNGLWSIFSANPIGTVVTLIGGAIALYEVFKNKTDDVAKAHSRESEEMKQARDTLDDYKYSMEEADKAKQNYLNKNMSEIDYYQDLYRELDTLIDKNGKVKKGYEDRAKFIVDTLNGALDTEIKMTGGVIKEYDKLEDKIKKVIEQKKAQITIDANEEKYSKAKEKQLELEENYANLMQENEQKQNDRNKAIQDMANYLDISSEKMEHFVNITNSASGKDILDEEGLKAYLESIGKASDKVDDWVDEYYLLRQAIADNNYDLYESDNVLKETKTQYDDNRQTISNYEQALTDMANGNYNAVLKMYDDTHNYIGKTDEETYSNYQKRIDMQKDYIQRLMENKDKYDKDYIQKEIETSATKIANLAKEQSKYRQKTEEEQKTIKGVWNQGLRDLIQDITGKDIQFKKTANGNIQMYIDGIENGKPMAEKEAKKVAEGLVNELNKAQKESKIAGINLVKGVDEGIKYQKGTAFSTITNFGKTLLSKFQKSLDERSPSKATKKMGVYLIKGLNIGITTIKNTTLQLLTDFGKSMLETISNNISNVSSEGKNLVTTFNTGVTNAIKSTEGNVKTIIDNYFTNLQNENKKQQSKVQKANEKEEKKLQQQIDKTTNKTTKKRLQAQLKTMKEQHKKKLNALKDQNTEIKKIYDNFGKTAITEFNSVLESATNGVTENLKSKIQDLADTMQKEIDNVNSKISSMQNKLSDYGGLFTTTSTKSGKQVYKLTDINKQIEALQKYNDNLTTLKSKVSESLMSEITDMSVDDALKYTEKLLNMSATDLKKYNEVYTKKLDLANNISNNFYADKIAEIKKNYTDKIKTEFENAQKEIEKIGTQTLQGFIKGMQNTNYTKEIKTIAQNIIKTMKKELKIHSPSVVFKNLGMFSGKGYVNGLADSLKGVKASISNMVGNIKNVGTTNNSNISKSNVSNFTQNIYAPKQPSRIELYRQTKNLLNYAKQGG